MLLLDVPFKKNTTTLSAAILLCMGFSSPLIAQSSQNDDSASIQEIVVEGQVVRGGQSLYFGGNGGLGVSRDSNAGFSRRYAGRVETGKHSLSDPMMGTD